MARSEKDMEIEGRTIPGQELLDECGRILSLAHRYPGELQAEGVKANGLTKIAHYREQLAKEQERLDAPPPKQDTLTKEQEQVMRRAYRWRALLLHRVDRAFSDESYARIKYRRLLHLYRNWRRVYEEITVLWELAKLDAKRLAAANVDEAFLEEGEDLRCLLLGYDPPDREAWREYEIKLANHRYGPPPKAPEIVMPDLPEVNDTSKGLAIARGRLYRLVREVSAAGKAAFSTFEGREPGEFESIRREFVMRIEPSELADETLLYFGAEPGKGGKAGKKVKKKKKKTRPREEPVEEAAPQEESAPVFWSSKKQEPEEDELPEFEDLIDEDIEPLPPEPLPKAPDRAVPLVRPSPTRGRK